MTTSLLAISLLSLAVVVLTVGLLALVHSTNLLRARVSALEVEVSRERPVVFLGQSGAPSLVYPASGRVEAAEIVDKGEQDRKAIRASRRGFRSNDPLTDDSEPIIVE